MIRNLHIEFRHMVVFHGEKTGITALLPVLGHLGTLKQFDDPNPSSVATLRQSKVEILLDGQPLREGGPVATDRRDLLIHTRDAIGPQGDVSPRAELLTGEVPSELNARVMLPGGTLRALDGECKKYPPAAYARWTFKRYDGTRHTQRLTDRVLFTLPFDDSKPYQLRASGPAGTWTFDLSKGASFEISNADEDAAAEGVAVKAAFNQLPEFVRLYGLLDLSNSPIRTHDHHLPESEDLPVIAPGTGALSPDVSCCTSLMSGYTNDVHGGGGRP